MHVNDDKVICFQDYALNLRRGCLSQGGHDIELRPKSFALLRYLVENAGRLAAKDELIGAVWGDVAVTDASLARCVSDVRFALHDQAQQIIKTVPRRGYLFTAPVSEVVNESTTRGQTPSAAQTTHYPDESRQLTVMACELVGLAALPPEYDPEDLREATTSCQRHCTQVVEQHHGYVARYSAGGLLVFFGYPQATEMDAENAVRAALTLQGLTVQLSTKVKMELELCIGIATGIVAIRDEFTAGNATDRNAVGETLILSERLQALAQPGQIVIAEDTRHLVGGLFRYCDLGPVALKGLATPVEISQVLGESGLESRFEAHHPARLTPLVGREEEIELLQRRWQQGKSGDGSVALLSGEPGIGKSRIAQKIVELVGEEPHTLLRLYCSPHRRDSALSPFISQVKQAAGIERADTEEQLLIKLAAALAQTTTLFGNAVPLVADLLSLPADDRYPRLTLTPEKRKEKTLAALLAYVEGLTASQPLLMVIEDVHWADPTSLELIDLIVERASRLRILLIVTFRPEFVSPWAGRLRTTLITLGRLPPPQCAEIIAGVTRGKHLPKPIIDGIVERSDGIPLFIEELTKTMVESGALSDTDDHSTTTQPQAAPEIPVTLRGSLLARLDRLGSAREVAQIGAALGRRFSYQLIAAVAGIPQQQLDHALARLVNAELIWRRGSPPDAEYTFKHALVQDAAYSTLPRDSRRILHTRIAETFDKKFSDITEGQPELLAFHYTEAGLIEKASRQWSKAGQLSLTRSALKEAEAQLIRALGQMEALPSTQALRREQIKAQIALANALMHTKGYAAPETKASLDKARLLVERAEALGESPEDPLLLFSVLHGFWVANHVAFNGDVIRGLATDFMALAEKQGTAFPLVLGHRVMGTSLLFLGDIAKGRAHLDRAMSLYDPAEHRPLGTRFGQEGGVAILSNRPLALWLLGYPEAAVKEADDALKYARDIGQTASSLYAATRIAWLHLVIGNYTVAAAQIQELMRMAGGMEDSYWTAAGTMLQGCLFALTGNGSTGIQMISSGIAASRLQGSNLLRMPWYLSCMARAHVELDQLDEAWRSIGDAITAMEATKETWQKSEVYRIAGDLALLSSRPDPVKAQAHFDRALTVAREQKAKSWELRAAMRLARLWRDQGERQRANDLLAPIYEWFTEGFDMPDLEEAKALLTELAA
jgi:class 3 adenylate cyclase/predicted ATPase